MKYSYNKVKINKPSKGLIVKEYQDANNPFPIDGCIVEIDNDAYPWKKNVGFHEMFFVISGEVKFEYENGQVEILNENDVFIIEPNVNHRTSAKKAKLFVACNPPFNIKNIIFKNNKKGVK